MTSAIAAAMVTAACGSAASPTAAVTTSPSASATPQPTQAPATPTPTAVPTQESTAPGFASFSAPHTVACNGQAVIYPHMTWSVRNATGVTISIDTPGGIYDTYGPSGATDRQSDMVPFACSKTPLQHTYYFTTVGGSGPPVTRKVTITGTP